MFSNLKPYKLIKEIITNDIFLPFVLVLTYLIFLFIARGVFPTSEELINSFENLYAKYGYEIIFMAALFESLVFVNLFAPGGGALVLGVVFARSGQTQLGPVILVASAGAIAGYMLDFVTGYLGLFDIVTRLGYGNAVSGLKERITKFGDKGLIISFAHPNLGAFASLAAGVMKIQPVRFITVTVLSTLIWATLWGVAIFAAGDIFLVILKKYSFLVAALIIGIVVLSRFWGKGGENLKSENSNRKTTS